MTKEIEVSFTTTVPADATDEQVLEWLRFNLSGGSCSNENPLADRDVEANFSSIQVD